MAGVVADKVIVELEAKLDRYNANVTRAVALWQQGTGDIRTDAIRAEQQVTKSFDSIRKSLLASVSVFAGAAGLNAIKNLADGYTRFTNQLKVAGLEGQKLGATQDQLFGIAQKYGVQLESIGTLYSRAAQAGDSLGASQGELLKFTNGVAAALKIQGGSAEESSGALLQLAQLLGTGTVRAEEFNSVNEGARPILQAVAAGIDKYRGSVSALRADVISGKVTSQDFFQGFLKGSADLEAKAAKANLTIGASFTILNNALGKYVGQTDQALSITARVSAGIAALADNLDTIVPALAGIAAGYAALKLGPVIFDAAAAATARALQIDQGLAAQILAGNASYVSRTQLVLAQATATSAAAAAEVAALEAEVTARAQDVASTAAEVTAHQTLVAAMGADVTAREALIASEVAHVQANGALVASEAALAAAQGRAAVASEAEAVAVAGATAAKRAGSVVTALFSGVLGTLTAALPIIAIGALTAAIIYYATSAKSASGDTKAFAEEGDALAANLAAAKAAGDRAAGAIASVGTQAATATPQMRAFAGATGEAANKLYELAKARRAELLEALHTDEVKARQAKETAQASRQTSQESMDATAGKVGPLPGVREAAAAAAAQEREAARREASAREAQDRVRRTPLTGFLAGSEKEGGRDVQGELARVTRDLVVARQRGIKAQVDTLEAQQFEIQQYKKYRAQGLSPQASQEASNRDKSDFQNASRGAAGDKAAKTGAAAGRKADAEAKRQAAAAARVERDAQGDEARYTSEEKRAEQDVLAARIDLADNAEARVQLEKDRIEASRADRQEEIRQQLRNGQLGDGDQGKARALELNRLNDEKAALQAQVVDLHERQRQALDAVDVAKASNQNERDLLQAQVPLLDTNKQRRDAALRLLDLQYEQERIELRAVTVANGRTATEEAIAKARLAQLDKLQTADKTATERQYAGPLQQYRDSLNDPRTQVEQAVADKLKSIDQGVTDAISKKLGVKDPFLKQLLSIFIEQNLLKPIYDAVSGAAGKAGGGGGGLFGSLLKLGGSFFGKTGGGGSGAYTSAGFSAGLYASGGHVSAGRIVGVNERGIEGFQPGGSGKIIPLGRMRGAGGGGGMALYQTVHVDASNSVNPDGYADHIVSRVRRETVGIVSRATAAQSKGLPGRLAQYQTDGL